MSCIYGIEQSCSECRMCQSKKEKEQTSTEAVTERKDDLISRKALISHIESEYRLWGEDYDVEQILGDIEDFSTVYDVDKAAVRLVKELERKSFIDYPSNKKNVIFTGCYRSGCGYIIKAGGANEKV